MSRPVRYALVAAAAAAFLYLPSVGFGFVYDDAIVVLNQPQVVGHDWRAMLVSPYHVGATARTPTGLYRPLTTLSLAANHRATGLHPWSYHLVNVLLHALCCALVVALGDALGLPPPASLVAGLAFAVHPVHVEPVANVAGRADLLSTAAALGALALFLRARRPASLAGIAVLTAAAVFSKESAITLAGVAVLWEAREARRRPTSPTAVAAVIGPIVLYLAARLLVLGGLTLGPGAVTPIENPVAGLSGVPRAATVLAALAHAVSLVLTPIRLSPDYGYADTVASTSLAAPGPLLGLVFLLALVAAVVALWRRAPDIAFLLGALAVTYAIVSNAFVLIGTILGDRLLYFPSVFACLLLGATAARLPRRPLFGVAAALVALLAARAAIYLPKWRSDATLFEYAARIAPRSVRAAGSWGAILAESGRLDESRPFLDRAVALAPDFIPARLNRAAAAISSGDWDAAEADARHVLELDPEDPVALRQLEAIAARNH